MSNFKFELGSKVTIICSGESGEIIARSESLAVKNQYYVRYQAADGRGVQQWWDEAAIG
jgi:hypothetical protein